MREPDTGEPTGLLIEQADSLARNRLPDWTEEQYKAGVLGVVQIAHGYGITGVTDADANEALLKAYHAIDSKEALQIHVVASISTPFGHRETPLDYDEIESLRDRYASENVDTRFVKIYLDGVPTAARSAAMLAPYNNNADFPNDYCGPLHVHEPILSQDIAALEKRGFTVKLHTAGDRAVRCALDAIEKAYDLSGRSDLRHELAHAGLVDAADLNRFQELNVVADLSPYIWYPAPIIDSIRYAVGVRAEQYWPIKNLLESGALLLAGSDWPAAVSSMDPRKGVQAMVTRRDPDGTSEDALWPEQAIRLGQALKIFTLDSALSQRRESVTGSITVGKWADLIVLDQNLFESDPDDIAATVVEMTMFHGRVVARK
jgi:predicted amidohydrolase YtcJ